MAVLVLTLLVLFSVLIVPLILVGLVLKLAFGLLVLPFRLAGLAIRLAVGIVASIVGAALGLLVLAAVVVAAGLTLLVPLLPFLLLGAGAWLIWRLARRPSAVQPGF